MPVPNCTDHVYEINNLTTGETTEVTGLRVLCDEYRPGRLIKNPPYGLIHKPTSLYSLYVLLIKVGAKYEAVSKFRHNIVITRMR